MRRRAHNYQILTINYMEILLKLETDYDKYGNARDEQIDTLAMAVDGATYNDIEEMNFDYLDSGVDYVREHYDHTPEFLATLSKEQREEYANDLDAFKTALKAYAEGIDEQQREDALPAVHPYEIAIQKAREDQEEAFYKEWLHGDYREAGLLKRASRFLSDKLNIDLEITYDEREDALTLTIPDEEEYTYLLEQHDLAPWRLEDREDQSYGELAEEQAKEEEATARFISDFIEGYAYDKHAKNRADAEKRREEAKRLREYRAGQDAKSAEELRKKILG